MSIEPGLISNFFLPAGGEPVIIRYDQLYNIPGPAGEQLPVKVLMCNSVLQGIMEEETGIIFTDMAGQSLDITPEQEFFGSAIPTTHLNMLEDAADPFDFNGDFIASRFLAKDHTNGTKNAFKDLHF